MTKCSYASTTHYLLGHCTLPREPGSWPFTHGRLPTRELDGSLRSHLSIISTTETYGDWICLYPATAPKGSGEACGTLCSRRDCINSGLLLLMIIMEPASLPLVEDFVYWIAQRGPRGGVGRWPWNGNWAGLLLFLADRCAVLITLLILMS